MPPNFCNTMPKFCTLPRIRRLGTLLVFLLMLLVGVDPVVMEGASQRSKSRTGQSKSKKASASKKKVGSSGKRTTKQSPSKRSRRARRAKVVPLSNLSLLRERELADGIRYSVFRSNGSKPVMIHAISMDRTIAGNAIRLVKGEDHANGLERLGDMFRRYDSADVNDPHAIVNGNFWRAVRNTMIGPCVIDGEVVELPSYKRWTSGFFDVRGQLYIDSLMLRGTVTLRGVTLPVSTVNRRQDSGVVVYNNFGGTTIPHVNTKEVERDFAEAVKDSVFRDRDSTEIALTKDLLRAEIARAQREANVEFPMVKVRVRYLRSPSVNMPLPCQVLGVDTGAVQMPLRGAVVSFPRTMLNGIWPKAGDTLVIRYTTNKHPNVRFMNAVCGTPRLVRAGVAKHEAQFEGSTGRRFIEDNLARTAIGTDRSGNRIIIAAIQADRPENGTHGATLQQTAVIMSLLGCYDAMNLDGGGSTGMVIDGDHVFFDGPDPLTRRVGLGVAVVRLSKILRGPR